jgi:hypothetical protein
MEDKKNIVLTTKVRNTELLACSILNLRSVLMLLRRITQHFKEQNWFAIGIDFFIVVIGVFIGLQVSNWNANLREIAEEKQLLLQLQTDVTAAVAVKTDWLNEIGSHRDSLLSALAVVQNKQDKPTISDKHCKAMWSSHLIFYPEVSLAALNDILSKGALHTSQGQALRPILLAYRERHQVIIQLNTVIRDFSNLGDTYGDAFPRKVVERSESTIMTKKTTEQESGRITDSTFHTNCQLDAIRTNQTIQNKLLSNLARTDGLLQRVKIEVTVLQKIEAALSKN